jgi:hypothetical protein
MNHFEQQSYYELLEVSASATREQILGAYERALETYSPDSIAVYTLVDPDQIEALRQRLTQARDVLCVLEQRLAYDQTIGVKRSPEDLALLRAESLRRAASAPVDLPTATPPEAEPVKAEPGVETAAVKAEPVLEAVPVLEAEPVLEAVPVLEAEPVLEAAVSGGAVAVVAEPVKAEPVLEAVPAAAMVQPVGRGSDTAPVPTEPISLAAKPQIHARPSAPVGRHGGTSVPPPLPARNGLRPALGRAEPGPRAFARVPSPQQLGEAPVLAQASAIATAESALAQVAQVVRKAHDSRTRLKTVVDVPADAEFNGELLRQVREGRGLSLKLLAERTRISMKHVENIEADRYDVLPASVYLRGILMSIARELGLDGLRVSRSYMGLVSAEDKKRR